ncbi:8511_t:CDS:2, partial [Scutellospora calospora]
MNHLIKGYMDAITSLSAFIQAFETALDSRKKCIELEIYRQDNNNITFQTTSPYEKQAAHFLTRYALPNSHLTEKFVNSIGTILELEIKTIELNQQPSDNNRINNPLIAKTKEQITINKENKQENSLKTLCLGYNVSLINQLKKQK